MFKIKKILKEMLPVATTRLDLRVYFSNSSCCGVNRRPLTSNSSVKPFNHFSFVRRPISNSSAQVQSKDQEIVIALGSNVGNRIQNFNEALHLMKNYGVTITRHGYLYETEPAYVTDQPKFLNSAIRGTTKLGPHDLLRVLKQIEAELGRTSGIRYGPRPIDLDILFYENLRVNSENLSVPHERIWERPFVLAPLIDLLGSCVENDTVATWHSFANCKSGLFGIWDKLGGESLIGNKGINRVLPLGDRLIDWSKKTHVMGILNLTPDSFSDGGKCLQVGDAVSHFRSLISKGADIIDIGAQSTRPFAKRLTVDQELSRLIPVLDEITKVPESEGIVLSVDTFYADVASEAVSRGVHVVNNVSGGTLDPKILRTCSDGLSVVTNLGVPFITMHMRGDPSTMQNCNNLHYEDVCKEVASELYQRVNAAELAGIPLWRIIADPGIGFSKASDHNLELISNLSCVRREIEKSSLGASHMPFLVGPSRKKFLGEICGKPDPVERDPATIAAVAGGILGGANLIRVHNVGFGVDAAKVCDALVKHKRKG
ncbi:folate synthesis bifunctional protein, mitochondrial-like [Carex rostrata]